MIIHSNGLKHIANPGVLAFPKVLICLDCASWRCNYSDNRVAGNDRGRPCCLISPLVVGNFLTLLSAAPDQERCSIATAFSHTAT